MEVEFTYGIGAPLWVRIWEVKGDEWVLSEEEYEGEVTCVFYSASRKGEKKYTRVTVDARSSRGRKISIDFDDDQLEEQCRRV